MELCRKTLSKIKKQKGVDKSFLDYLLEIIISANPTENCNVLGRVEDWKILPRDKSLFYTDENCGLPIGNLSSQLFSNVYLNVLINMLKEI